MHHWRKVVLNTGPHDTRLRPAAPSLAAFFCRRSQSRVSSPAPRCRNLIIGSLAAGETHLHCQCSLTPFQSRTICESSTSSRANRRLWVFF